jgi:hypothetical protein
MPSDRMNRDECREPCDHCRPDIWHACVRPFGHIGYHSCELDPDDVFGDDDDEAEDES